MWNDTNQLVLAMVKLKFALVPNGEIIWETYIVNGKERYIVTSKPVRDYYYIYEVLGGSLKKLGKARTPVELRSYVREDV